MPVIVKFVVANEENAHKVSEMAQDHYAFSSLKDNDKENTVSGFLNKANSFTREWLMSFNVKGEDEDRVEEPLALAVLVSANIPAEVVGDKPLFIEKTIPAKEGDGTAKVIARIQEIAIQRKHDSIWAEAPAADTAVITAYKNSGFELKGKRGGAILLNKAV